MSETTTTAAAELTLTPAQLAPYIQHTRIDPDTTREQIIAHAQEAATHGFNAAMVPASWLPEVVTELSGTGIEVASALDFPTVGVMTSAGKAAEAAEIARLGATQLDIGVQIGWLKSGRYDDFREDIAGVVRASGLPVKVMLELPLLTETERETAVELAIEAGASFLKNASSGQIETAHPASVRYLVDRARNGVQVKASGSIKTYRQALQLLRAGASLLGTSAGLSIITDTGDETTASY
ncbi:MULTISPECIES: deoxyribose-phosphate aldolase [Streptomyces]|uniref:Deoxyribose-phosphate aldolase n=1 Tax=Streptomyces rutgersensis TaxID=53451 RepID=A0ABX6RWG3_9ACTN|nr:MULTISPECIES: deoxyribose-phosphate aldolase [Streptomyces]NEE24415.1 deoxyribose-phosphate aldolase [Streptomyces sp. SID7982]WSU34337.1 deoxyribose-phosphate aldolase [Streptomyces gougerotii]PJM80317.1 deoxyribose-phosphate aldolase [Streptomyces sp. TSRI0384-2]QNE84561.1 deoxyribose-phosphate aldolase [Streptomyces rutgersensis]RPK78861.1 Deoxyribose-phosphate aldolase 1 [Streptomyces sp. ADI98-12]